MFRFMLHPPSQGLAYLVRTVHLTQFISLPGHGDYWKQKLRFILAGLRLPMTQDTDIPNSGN